MRPACPTCGRTEVIAQITDWPYFPFCSHKCKLIDLGRWFNEEYSVPSDEPNDAEMEMDEG